MASEMDEGQKSMDATEESHEEDRHSKQDTGASDTAGRPNQENGEEEPNPQDNKKESDGEVDSKGKKGEEKEIDSQAEKNESNEKEEEINTNETGNKEEEKEKEKEIEQEEEVRENKQNIEQGQESSEADIKSDEKCVKEEETDEKEKIADSENLAPEAATAEIKAKDEVKAEVNKESTRDKQEKTKGKSASIPRPSMQTSSRQRSARPSARRDAMAKFQQDSTPGVRNFKVQKTSAGISAGASIKQKILHWCSSKTRGYEGVSIENFSSSWSDGLAFCALLHRFFPSAFDFSSLKASEREKNFTLAFSMAESLAGCCPLLDVSDMVLMGNKPDPFSVFTYVQALCQHLSKIEQERRDQKKAEESKKQGENKVEQGEEAGDVDESGEEQKNAMEEEAREQEGNADEEKGGTEGESSTQVETEQTICEASTDQAVIS